MAENEIKKVITVDLGNTSTSLREYKRHIDDLRGSLLQLDETSEEYDKIAKEIKTEQDKLNEVMKVGKQTTDAAEGSYNQLSQTMSELKKQWKATADEAERDELGKQILDINNQLKELDASTGNFQRNVGDYANAFEKAFDKCLDGIKNIDGPLGEIGGTVKNMLPVIKNINSTALNGLSGIKKGIASTGIGLLVIAVSELITHWKDLIKIVGISDEQFADFKETAINTFKNIVSGVVGVGNAIGNFLLAPIRATIDAFKGLGSIIEDVFTGNFDKVKEDATAAFNAIKGIGQKAIDFKGNYEQGRQIADNLIAGIEERLKSNDAEEAAEEVGKTIGKTITKGIEEENRTILDIIMPLDSKTASTIEQRVQDYSKIIEEELSKLSAEYKQKGFELSLIDFGSDQEKLDAEYNLLQEHLRRQIALRVKYGEDYSDLLQEMHNNTALYNKKTEENTKKSSENEVKYRRAAYNSITSSAANLFGALSEMSEEGSEEQKAFAIMETIINTLQSIMGTWAGYSSMGPWGVAAAAVQTAALAATGAATIVKMKSTTKDSSSASVSAPQVQTPSMTSVTPLLDETSDINRMDMSGLQGNSTQEQQSLRVYVVDQDIRDANNKAEVVENNATF